MIDWPSGTLGSGRANTKASAARVSRVTPAGRLSQRRTAARRGGYRRAVVIETPAQRGREVGRRLRFEPGNDAAPLSRHQRYRRLADAKMAVGRVQAALGLHRQLEIPLPVVLGDDGAAGRLNGQREKSRIGEPETFSFHADVGRKTADRGRAVMVAIVGEQRQP